MFNLTLPQAADVGAFLGGVASTLGLLGLFGVWLQWHSEKNRQKADAERRQQEEKADAKRRQQEHEKEREQHLLASERTARGETVRQQMHILSRAHEAFATMMRERDKLYLQAMRENDRRSAKNYAALAAARQNEIFVIRLASWIQTLSRLDRGVLDLQQVATLVAFSKRVGSEDFKLVKYFATEELDELQQLLDADEPVNEELASALGVSHDFSLSPLSKSLRDGKHFKALNEACAALEKKYS